LIRQRWKAGSGFEEGGEWHSAGVGEGVIEFLTEAKSVDWKVHVWCIWVGGGAGERAVELGKRETWGREGGSQAKESAETGLGLQLGKLKSWV
jgi:hypothetical protein